MSLFGVMIYHFNCWCLAIFAMLTCYLFTDVSSLHMFVVDVLQSHMFVILLWFSISLLAEMFYHSNCWCLAISAMLSCYLFAHVSPLHMFVPDVSPSHMFVILLWFSMSLLGVMFYRLNYWCVAIMLPFYLFSDVSPLHKFVVDVSPSHMFFILLDPQYHC